MRDLVVVGGGVAAVRLIEELRRLGSDDRIVLVSAETRPPYDRPPLTKKFLELGGEPPELARDLAGLNADLQLGRAATALDSAGRVVTLDDGRQLPYSQLVIATGAEPRRLPALGMRENHVVRTADDAIALRESLLRHRRVVIIGAGFIGCEVASTALVLGCQVTLIEALAAPLVAVLGDEAADHVSAMHRSAGVDLRCGCTVECIEGDGAERRLQLSDGSWVDAPVVVVAIGVRPRTDWLAGSGLTLGNGVVCDEFGRTSAPGVWAIGDVANWWHPQRQEHRRFEHWTSAADQARAVAATLLGRTADVDPVPYFWSDQHGIKMQMLGVPSPQDEATDFPIERPDGRVMLFARDGELTAVLGFNAPKDVMRLRENVRDGRVPAAAAGGTRETTIR